MFVAWFANCGKLVFDPNLITVYLVGSWFVIGNIGMQIYKSTSTKTENERV